MLDCPLIHQMYSSQDTMVKWTTMRSPCVAKSLKVCHIDILKTMIHIEPRNYIKESSKYAQMHVSRQIKVGNTNAGTRDSCWTIVEIFVLYLHVMLYLHWKPILIMETMWLALDLAWFERVSQMLSCLYALEDCVLPHKGWHQSIPA